jgi:hypothetical protein
LCRICSPHEPTSINLLLKSFPILSWSFSKKDQLTLNIYLWPFWLIRYWLYFVWQGKIQYVIHVKDILANLNVFFWRRIHKLFSIDGVLYSISAILRVWWNLANSQEVDWGWGKNIPPNLNQPMSNILKLNLKHSRRGICCEHFTVYTCEKCEEVMFK